MSEAQKLEELGKLAGSIAHDFNNLLTAINGYADLALITLPEDSPIRPYLEEIRKAGSRAADLTRELLVNSRRESAQVSALPAKPDQPEATTLPAGAKAPPRTILMAEDEEPVRNFVRLVLEGQGYVVLEASDGEEALGFVSKQETRIDLLLSDVVMPGMGGRELGAKSKEIRPDLKVVYMSGYAEDEVFRQGYMESYSILLPKPFTAKSLIEKVEAALREGAQVEQPAA